MFIRKKLKVTKFCVNDCESNIFLSLEYSFARKKSWRKIRNARLCLVVPSQNTEDDRPIENNSKFPQFLNKHFLHELGKYQETSIKKGDLNKIGELLFVIRVWGKLTGKMCGGCDNWLHPNNEEIRRLKSINELTVLEKGWIEKIRLKQDKKPSLDQILYKK